MQVSLFTSGRVWWADPIRSEIIDEVPREQSYTSGDATLLADGNGTFNGIACGSARRGATTFKHGVTFRHIVPTQAVELDEMLQGISPGRSRQAATDIVHAGFGRFSESASRDIRRWVEARHPLVSAALEGVLGAEPSWMATSPEAGAQHRLVGGAVNDALAAAGIDRQQALLGIVPPPQPDHFSLTTRVAVDEDAIVLTDLDIFPKWDLSALHPSGRIFKEPTSGRTLAVLHANKHPIETTSGADLIYFVDDYESFVLVQYKRIRREGARKVFRPDDKLDDQIRMMTTLEEKCRASSRSSLPSLDDHRLARQLGFLKLCETDQPMQAVELLDGKYVPLELWKLMEARGFLRGPREGRCLDYRDVTRYFNNTTFASLVSEGWVGSTSHQFEPLLEAMCEGYDAGRTIILSLISLGRTPRRPASRQPNLRSQPITW